MEFVNMLVTGVMDAVEEFFSSITAPSTKFTFKAFVYSLVFLAGSIAFEIFDIPCFIQWQEALTCSVLMTIIVLIDTSVRGNIRQGIGKFKELASRLTYTGEEPEEIEMEDENNGGSE